MAGKSKLFLENFIVYGMGSVINKIIPFIMLPIISRLIPEIKYYGLNDIVSVIVAFGVQIVLVGAYDAMFRLFFDCDDRDYRKKVCSTAFFIVIMSGSIAVLVLLILRNMFANMLFNSESYTVLIFIAAVNVFVTSLQNIAKAPTRMQNKRKVFLVTNTIAPLIGYTVSIPLIIKGQYLLALPLADLFSTIIMLIVFLVLNRNWFSLYRVERKLIKDLLVIGIPLVPTFLIYWMLSGLGKIMIGNMIGTDAVGIYGIGARLALISQLIYSGFSGGWAFFTYSTMKDDDHTYTVSKTYELMGVISFLATTSVMPLAGMIFRILFTGEYIKGYIVFPYLFLSPLILMLFQISISQFLVMKKSWPITLILVVGAITNVSLNYLLIPLIGIEGAAISSLLGYLVSALISTVIVRMLGKLYISWKFVAAAISTVCCICLIRLGGIDKISLASTLVAFFNMLLITVLYKKDIMLIFSRVFIKLKMLFNIKGTDKFAD